MPIYNVITVFLIIKFILYTVFLNNILNILAINRLFVWEIVWKFYH